MRARLLRCALPALAFIAAAPETDLRDADLPPVGAPSPCIACAAPIADLGDLFSGTDLEKLRGGEVLIVHAESKAGEPEMGTRASALVRRSPREVWSTLTDFESWPAFMPLIDGTEIARREGDQIWVRQRYSIMFIDMGHTSVYDLAPRSGELRWALDEKEPADIEASAGRWRLAPVDGGASTLIRYEAVMSPGRAVPDWVKDMLQRRSLRALLMNLRKETERRNPSADPEVEPGK